MQNSEEEKASGRRVATVADTSFLHDLWGGGGSNVGEGERSRPVFGLSRHASPWLAQEGGGVFGTLNRGQTEGWGQGSPYWVTIKAQVGNPHARRFPRRPLL